MLSSDRRKKLLEIVKQQGFASLPDLADALQVSESTVRRDLAHLERKGGTKRTHGGAFYTGPTPQLVHFRHRQEAQWVEKKAIALAAAELIEDADTLILDGGSTTYELARLLANRPLQVVTNSVPVLNLFSSAANVDLIVVGGYVHTRSGAIHGPYADEMLKNLRVRKAILSAAGVSETGLYNSNLMLATTQRAMVQSAEEVIVVADSTKFGHQSLAHICPLDAISTIVVDDGLSPEWQAELTSQGIQLKIARRDQQKGTFPDGS